MAAISQVQQKIAIANGFMAASAQLNQAWSTIQKYNNMFSQGQYGFSEGDFSTYPPLQYFDEANMATLITELNAFITWMNANGQIIFKAAPAAPVSV